MDEKRLAGAGDADPTAGRTTQDPAGLREVCGARFDHWGDCILPLGHEGGHADASGYEEAATGDSDRLAARPSGLLREAAQEWADLCNDHDLNERGQAIMARLRAALAATGDSEPHYDAIEGIDEPDVIGREAIFTLATGDSEGPLDADIMGQAIHRVFNHGFHGGGRDAADGDLARSLFAEYARLSGRE